MIVVLMGVTGSGKTTVGRVLARELGWKFCDADDYHPAANIEKMPWGFLLLTRIGGPGYNHLPGGSTTLDTVARASSLPARL